MTIGDWKWARGNTLCLQDNWRLEIGKGQYSLPANNCRLEIGKGQYSLPAKQLPIGNRQGAMLSACKTIAD